MTDPYRYACARCGSVSVKQLRDSEMARDDYNRTGWTCNNKLSDHSYTPVVWDKKLGSWKGRKEHEPTQYEKKGRTSFKAWPGGSGF